MTAPGLGTLHHLFNDSGVDVYTPLKPRKRDFPPRDPIFDRPNRDRELLRKLRNRHQSVEIELQVMCHCRTSLGQGNLRVLLLLA
jgi:hypothetical protein